MRKVSGSFSFHIFEVGGSYSKEETQTIQMTLKPEIVPETERLGAADIETSLDEAITQIKMACKLQLLVSPCSNLKMQQSL